jgi:recombinational DNA repair ATPase RecF
LARDWSVAAADTDGIAWPVPIAESLGILPIPRKGVAAAWRKSLSLGIFHQGWHGSHNPATARPMALDRIRLGWFRNHRATALEGTGKFNLLVGENGAGKTNILEAISLFAPGRGLRRAALPDMAGQSGDGAFAVSADLLHDGVGVRLGTGTAPDKPGRRIVRVNGADASALSLSEWLGLFWLTPAMDRLFMDSPGGRRRFVDRLALALDPAHAAHAARTEAAIRERNRLLSAPQEPDARWLDAIEVQIAEAGGALASGRARLIEALNAKLETLPPRPLHGLRSPIRRAGRLLWPNWRRRCVTIAAGIARRSAH